MSDSKHDPDDNNEMDEEEIETPAFGPAALGLHRVGTALPQQQKQQPIQVLNARGMPARIRKKNKLFFDDDVVQPSKSPIKRLAIIKSPIKTPSKVMKKRKGVVSKYMRTPHGINKLNETVRTEQTVKNPSLPSTSTTAPSEQLNVDVEDPPPMDRETGQKIGMQLRNLLKLPKAHKWVSYEWFYSYIDKPLFDGENEFEICLRESLPALKTRSLTRIEWSKIRRMMGKPRRCSQTFFDQERRELERRRQKIRLLQSQKFCDISFARDLPKEIPMPLTVATKVTARLRTPQDGIFTGAIDAVESATNSYRVAFDRPGLGHHTIPDYEILSNEMVDTVPISSIAQDYRPKLNGPCFVASPIDSKSSIGPFQTKHDPLLGGEPSTMLPKLKESNLPKDSIGGYKLKLLEMIVRMRKSLNTKHNKLLRLQTMNTEAEAYRSLHEPFPEEFQRRYAAIVIGMERLNNDVIYYLSDIQTMARDLTKDTNVLATLTPSYLREKSRDMARESVDKNNKTINDPEMLRLITDLATIMWVGANLTSDLNGIHVQKVLDGCMTETRSQLKPENIECFVKNVQVHLRHIQMGIENAGTQMD